MQQAHEPPKAGDIKDTPGRMSDSRTTPAEAGYAELDNTKVELMHLGTTVSMDGQDWTSARSEWTKHGCEP